MGLSKRQRTLQPPVATVPALTKASGAGKQNGPGQYFLVRIEHPY
jgi:hypothetical protein